MLESIPVPQEQIEHLQRLVDGCRHMVFFGGAGVSTESGLVDFRGQNGAYNTPSEIPLEQVYSHDFFFQRTDEIRKRVRREQLRGETGHQRHHVQPQRPRQQSLTFRQFLGRNRRRKAHHTLNAACGVLHFNGFYLTRGQGLRQAVCG